MRIYVLPCSRKLTCCEHRFQISCPLTFFHQFSSLRIDVRNTPKALWKLRPIMQPWRPPDKRIPRPGLESAQLSRPASCKWRSTGIQRAGFSLSSRRNLASAPSCCEPEFVPVSVVTSFFQHIRITQPCLRPELAGPFASALPRATARLYRPAPDRPISPGQCLIIHPSGMIDK